MAVLHWRRAFAALLAAVVAFAFFLAVGAMRGVGATQGTVWAPAYAYAIGTANTTDRIIRGMEDNRFDPRSGFFWIYHRIVEGEEVQPPGLALASTYNINFEGFGLATGMIGALWLDMGSAGPAVGGLFFGAIAALVLRLWRSRGNWWCVLYAYVLVALLLSITQHPMSNYYAVVMPACLIVMARWSRTPAKTGVRRGGRGSRASRLSRQ